MSRVAVFGASGFIGATFVERLLARRTFDVKPIIHTTGAAWRLSRHGIPLHTADVRESAEVRKALEGCTHVVNCALGSNDVMFKGLATLLAESRAAGVRRFVHLSSIALFGEQKPDALLDDDAPANAVKGQYSAVKLRQDEMVRAAAGGGLPAVVICPAHVFGAYSPFLSSCVAAARAGRLALVDGGSLPASYVDVSNLCQALEQALGCETADGARIVVEDGQDKTWFDVARALAPLAECAPDFASIDRADARRIAELSQARPSLRASTRALVAHFRSPAIADMVKGDPLLLNAAQATLRVLQGISPSATARLLGRSPAARAAEAPAAIAWDAWGARAQHYSVRFTGRRAREVLGYVPERSFDQSMAAFSAWYRATHGLGGRDWPLLRQLLA